MSVTRRRAKAAARTAHAQSAFPTTCSNCGRPGSHFAVPALGDPGFYMCDQLPAAPARRKGTLWPA